MLLINLFGGPGAGKSTAAAALFVKLKSLGVVTELVTEVARDFIYKGQTDQFDNQFYITAKQYSKVRNLERHNCQVVVSDAPLMQGMEYAKDFSYYPELKEIVRKVEAQYDVINVYCRRAAPFSTFGRSQASEDEAKLYDEKIYNCIPQFDIEIRGDEKGHDKLIDYVTEKLGIQEKTQFHWV